MSLQLQVYDEATGTWVPATDELLNSMPLPGFSIPAFDRVELSYTSGSVTGVVYKKGTTTVGTLALTYDQAGNIQSIVRS
jgi:YD repeat-containing protein